MKYNKLRPGNLLEYVGSLSDYTYKIGEIISIDKMNGEDTFSLRVRNWKKEDNEIRAYKKDVWPVTLTADHLTKLGFIKEEVRNIFSNWGMNLLRPIFTKPVEGGGILMDDKGFVVVEKTLPVPFTEEQMIENTTFVTSLHTFQNYLRDTREIAIDPNLFM